MCRTTSNLWYWVVESGKVEEILGLGISIVSAPIVGYRRSVEAGGVAVPKVGIKMTAARRMGFDKNRYCFGLVGYGSGRGLCVGLCVFVGVLAAIGWCYWLRGVLIWGEKFEIWRDGGKMCLGWAGGLAGMVWWVIIYVCMGGWDFFSRIVEG